MCKNIILKRKYLVSRFKRNKYLALNSMGSWVLCSHQFGKFWRPSVGGEDLLPGNPVFVHSAQRLHGSLALWGFIPSNQHPVWVLQVLDSRSLCQKLRVGQHLESKAKDSVQLERIAGHFHASIWLSERDSNASCFFIPVSSGWVLCSRRICAGCFLLPSPGLCFSQSRFCTHLSSAQCVWHKLRCTLDLPPGLSPFHRFLLECSPGKVCETKNGVARRYSVTAKRSLD